jgi:carboxymethylenebutenolidase
VSLGAFASIFILSNKAHPMPQLIKNYLSLSIPDGTTMQVYVAFPSGAANLPGVLVFQEAFGVNGHIRDVTERIAAEGYYAIAPELYHRTADKGYEASYSDFEAVKKHFQAITLEGLRQDITTAHKFMTRQNEVDAARTASIGFCLGGRVSFLANTFVPLKAAACFYGGGISDLSEDTVQKSSGALLLCWGGLDQHITRDKVAAVTALLDKTGKDYVNVVFSKANHAFFCDARPSYHPASAHEAWALVKAFWKEHV